MRRFLAATAAALLAVLVLMVVFSVAGSPDGDTVIERLADLRGGDDVYRLGFFFASLVPAALLAFMAAVASLSYARLHRDQAGFGAGAGMSLVAGLLLVAGYAPLSAVAYVSQYTELHWLLARDLPAAARWYFGNEHGIPLTLDLLAYAVWGAGALFLVWPLLGSRRTATRVLAWSLLASAVTSLAAFGLHALDSGAAAPLSTISGVLVAPAALAALFVATSGDDEVV